MQRPPLTHGGSQTGSVHPAPLQPEVQEHSFTAMQVPPFSHAGLQDAAWGVGGEVPGLHTLHAPCTPPSFPLLTVCTAFPCPGLRADTRSPCHTGASVQTVTFTVFTTYAHTLNAMLCLSHVHITHNKHNYAHVCVTHHTCTHACTHTRTHTHTHTHTYIYTWCECMHVTCTKGKGFVCSVGTVHETVAHHVQGQGNGRFAVAVEQMHLEEDAILITLDHNCSVSGGEGGGTEMLGRNASTHQNTSMYTDNQTASSPPLPHSDRRKRSGSPG